MISHFLYKDANMLLHCVLLELEAQLVARGKLPPHFCIQMDKGPENSNHTTLCMMAILVSRKVFKSVLITYSSNGHSHNDQDGVFAIIWEFIQDKNIFTPQQLIEFINTSLFHNNTTGQHCIYVDMVVDYAKFLEGCMADFTR